MTVISVADYRASITGRGNKYRAKPETVDGHRFASKAEAHRYGELRMAERAGNVTDLRLQPSYALHCPTGVEVGRYVADFEYRTRTGCLIVEDVKSPATVANALFRWKRKHFEAEYGIDLVLIGAS